MEWKVGSGLDAVKVGLGLDGFGKVRIGLDGVEGRFRIGWSVR